MDPLRVTAPQPAKTVPYKKLLNELRESLNGLNLPTSPFQSQPSGTPPVSLAKTPPARTSLERSTHLGSRPRPLSEPHTQNSSEEYIAYEAFDEATFLTTSLDAFMASPQGIEAEGRSSGEVLKELQTTPPSIKTIFTPSRVVASTYVTRTPTSKRVPKTPKCYDVGPSLSPDYLGYDNFVEQSPTTIQIGLKDKLLVAVTKLQRLLIDIELNHKTSVKIATSLLMRLKGNVEDDLVTTINEALDRLSSNANDPVFIELSQKISELIKVFDQSDTFTREALNFAQKARERNSQLWKELQESKQALEESKQELEESSLSALAKERETTARYLDKISELQQKLADSTAQFVELENSYRDQAKALEEESTSLLTSLESSHAAEMHALKVRLNKSELEVEQKTLALSSAEEKRAELNTKLIQSQACQIEKLKEINEEQIKIATLTEKIYQLESSSEPQDKIELIKVEKKQLEYSITELKEAVDKYRFDNVALQSSIDDINAQHKRILEEKDALIASLVEEKANYREQIFLLKEEKQTQKRTSRTSTGLNPTHAHASVTTRDHRKNQQLAGLKEQLAGFKEQLDNQKLIIKDLKTKSSKNETELLRAQKELIKLKRKSTPIIGDVLREVLREYEKLSQHRRNPREAEKIMTSLRGQMNKTLIQLRVGNSAFVDGELTRNHMAVFGSLH